jgi:hypothetical protein
MVLLPKFHIKVISLFSVRSSVAKTGVGVLNGWLASEAFHR